MYALHNIYTQKLLHLNAGYSIINYALKAISYERNGINGKDKRKHKASAYNNERPCGFPRNGAEF